MLSDTTTPALIEQAGNQRTRLPYAQRLHAHSSRRESDCGQAIGFCAFSSSYTFRFVAF